MKAYLIDADQRSITEIDFVGDYEAMERMIDCYDLTTGAFLNGSIAKGFDALLVSDDLLEDGDDPKGWFQIDADRESPSSHPIPGRGLDIGTDKEGENCSASISLEELTARVTFKRAGRRMVGGLYKRMRDETDGVRRQASAASLNMTSLVLNRQLP
jgi:hypothetical protein